MKKIKVIVTAGGSSSRFGNKNKLLSILRGKPVIQYSVDLFTEMGYEIVIPANKNALSEYRELFKTYNNVSVIEGGNTRQHSIRLALETISDCSFVVIHDAARPLIKRATAEKCIEAAKQYGGAIVGVKTTDTIKQISDNKIECSLDRSKLINVQTPQVFEFNKIKALHEKYSDESYTDDSALFEAAGEPVYFVNGDYSNIKITTEIDLKLADLLLE